MIVIRIKKGYEPNIYVFYFLADSDDPISLIQLGFIKDQLIRFPEAPTRGDPNRVAFAAPPFEMFKALLGVMTQEEFYELFKVFCSKNWTDAADVTMHYNVLNSFGVRSVESRKEVQSNLVSVKVSPPKPSLAEQLVATFHEENIKVVRSYLAKINEKVEQSLNSEQKGLSGRIKLQKIDLWLQELTMPDGVSVLFHAIQLSSDLIFKELFEYLLQILKEENDDVQKIKLNLIFNFTHQQINLLIYTVVHKKKALLEYLLDCCDLIKRNQVRNQLLAEISSKQFNGRSLVEYGVESNDPEILTIILNKARVELDSHNRKSLLWLAINKNLQPMFRFLMSRGEILRLIEEEARTEYAKSTTANIICMFAPIINESFLQQVMEVFSNPQKRIAYLNKFLAEDGVSATVTMHVLIRKNYRRICEYLFSGIAREAIREHFAHMNGQGANALHYLILYFAADFEASELVERIAFILDYFDDAHERKNYLNSVTRNFKLTALELALKKNYPSKVIGFFIENGARVTSQTVKLATKEQVEFLYPLHQQARNLTTPHVEIPKLVAQGFDANAEDHEGYTPFMWAVMHNNVAMLEYYWQRKEEKSQTSAVDYINAACKTGETPLMLAAAQGCVESIQFLLKCKARINDTDLEERTALMKAVIANQDQSITALFNAPDLDPWCADRSGQTPVMRASHAEPKTLTALLLAIRTKDPAANVANYIIHNAYNAEQSVREHSPLLMALIKGDILSAQSLLNLLPHDRDRRQQLLFTDRAGDSVLILVLNSETPIAIKLKTLEFIVTSLKTLKFEKTDLMEEKRDDAFLLQLNDALRLAVKKRDKAIAQFLLQSQADPNDSDGHDDFPLSLAMQHKDFEMMELLIEYRANINKTQEQNDHATLLMTALSKPSYESDVIKFLCDHHADIFAIDVTGRTR